MRPFEWFIIFRDERDLALALGNLLSPWAWQEVPLLERHSRALSIYMKISYQLLMETIILNDSVMWNIVTMTWGSNCGIHTQKSASSNLFYWMNDWAVIGKRFTESFYAFSHLGMQRTVEMETEDGSTCPLLNHHRHSFRSLTHWLEVIRSACHVPWMGAPTEAVTRFSTLLTDRIIVQYNYTHNFR